MNGYQLAVYNSTVDEGVCSLTPLRQRQNLTYYSVVSYSFSQDIFQMVRKSLYLEVANSVNQPSTRYPGKVNACEQARNFTSLSHLSCIYDHALDTYLGPEDYAESETWETSYQLQKSLLN